VDVGRCPDEDRPVFSPDGRRLAFAKYDGVPGLAIADSELRHVRSIFPFGHMHGAPDIDGIAWSPNGGELAFTAHNDNGKRFRPVGGRALFVIQADGTRPRRLTPWRLDAGGVPDWSPSSDAFSSARTPPRSTLPAARSATSTPSRPRAEGSGSSRTCPPARVSSSAPTRPTARRSSSRPPPAGRRIRSVTIDARGGASTHVTATKNAEGTPDWGPSH
jgi:dipeptidyl aminopeptidase/acylaminoacyl peptidase